MSLATIFKRQGMTAREIRAALDEMRSVFDVFVIDRRTGRRRIRFGPSIFDVTEGTTRKLRPHETRTKGAAGECPSR